jgi:hypothetical protein
MAFERFRLEATLSSGVTPKRYFGFFDEKGDTARYETTLRETVTAVVALANAHADRHGLAARVTDIEVAVTFLAEGGALLLTDRMDDLEQVHPINGIGLDNFREGFARQRPLVDAIDAELGTHLGALTVALGDLHILRRTMSFREAVAGTAVMYLDEKEVAAELLRRADPPVRLHTLPLDRQFVVASLVYNSGILFSDERVEQILSFATADYLAEVNLTHRGKRAWLPVRGPADAEAHLIAGDPLPRQLTSWNAVYHVLQRYGAFVALRRFSNVFDEAGRYRIAIAIHDHPGEPPR